jgi:HlyD family secretion protein
VITLKRNKSAADAAMKPRTSKRTGVITLLVLGSLITGSLALAYVFIAKPGDKTETPTDTVLVRRGVADVTVLATGVIKPQREVKISPKTTGLVKKLLVQQGDFVKEGQVVALMDDSNIQGQIQSARAAVLIAQDTYDKARNGNRPQEILASRYQTQRAEKAVGQSEKNVNRLVAQMEALKAQIERDKVFADRQAYLAKEGAVSDQDRMNALTTLRITQSQLDAAEKELEQAKVAIGQSEADFQAVKQQQNLMRAGSRTEDIAIAQHTVLQAQGNLNTLLAQWNDMQVRAPFAGTITQKYAEQGAIVTPTTSAATTSATSSSIVSLAGSLELLAQVPEASISNVTLGQPVQITATAYPDKVFNGTVTRIAPEAIVTQNVTTFEVRARIDDVGQKFLRSGMNVRAKFSVTQNKSSLLIPTVSVVTRRSRVGVLVSGPDGKPTFKQVKVGPTVGNETIVESGLNEGDRIFIGLAKDQLQKFGYGGRRPTNAAAGPLGGLGGGGFGGRGGRGR